MSVDEKLRNKMLAHNDGIYQISSRADCDELVTQIIDAFLELEAAKGEQPNDCRTAFEKKFAGRGYDLKHDNSGSFSSYSTRAAFNRFREGWDARASERESIDALLREIRERSFDCEIHTNDCGTTVKITHPSGKNRYKSSIEGDGDLLACIREAYASAQRNDLDEQGKRGCVHCGGSGYVTQDIVHKVWTPSNVSSGGANVVETIPAPCRFCNARSDLAVTTRIEIETK